MKALKVLKEKKYIQRTVSWWFLRYTCKKPHGVSVGNKLGLIKSDIFTREKHFIPYVIQGCPEVSLNGQWLDNKKEGDIKRLAVRGFVTDNASAFSIIFKKCRNSKFSILHPCSRSKCTYLFFDTVSLVKNISKNSNKISMVKKSCSQHMILVISTCNTQMNLLYGKIYIRQTDFMQTYRDILIKL